MILRGKGAPEEYGASLDVQGMAWAYGESTIIFLTVELNSFESRVDHCSL